jgi:CBS domain-containing protein
MSTATSQDMDSNKHAERNWLRRALVALVDDATRALVGIGRRLDGPALATVPVSAVMLSRVETVSIEQPLDEVAELLVAGHHEQLPVVDNGAPVGVLTRGDVATGLQRSGPHAPVSAAPRHDVVTVTPSDSLADVLDRLRETPDAVALVVDRGAPVGLLTVDRLEAYVASG